MANKIATTYTIQQLMSNEVAVPLKPTDFIGFVVEMPFTSNPNGWATGSINFVYGDLIGFDTPAQFVEALNGWFNSSFSSYSDYDSVKDALVFGLDTDGYLTVEPRPNLGYTFVKVSALEGPLSDLPNVKDLGDIVGITRAEKDATAQCGTLKGPGIDVLFDMQRGEVMEIYVATATGDELLASITRPDLQNDINEETQVLQEISAALMSKLIISNSTQSLLNPDDTDTKPTFSPWNGGEECMVVKFRLYPNSDATTRFYVKDTDPEGTRVVWPKAERYDMVTFHLPPEFDPVEPEVPVEEFIKFRNRDGETEHRVELIPTDESGVMAVINTKPGEVLELGETAAGFGFCLSRDLCFETGKTLQIKVHGMFLQDLEARAYVREKRRNTLIGEIEGFNVKSRADLVEEIANQMRSTGLGVTVELNELWFNLVITNETSKNITLELLLPMVLTEDGQTVVETTGTANVEARPKLYGTANYSVGFCIANETQVAIPIGCAGSTPQIIIGPMEDYTGNVMNISVNDVDLGWHPPGQFQELLLPYGISMIPYNDSNDLAIRDGEGKLQVTRAYFVNTGSEYKRVRIGMNDVPPPSTNHTPENATLGYDVQTQWTTFCLAPASSNISCVGATNEAKTAGFWKSWKVWFNGIELKVPVYNTYIDPNGIRQGRDIEGYSLNIVEILRRLGVDVQMTEMNTIFKNLNTFDVRLEFQGFDGDPDDEFNDDDYGVIWVPNDISDLDNLNPTVLYGEEIEGKPEMTDHFSFCLAAAERFICTPTKSEWSSDITFDMVNLPNSSGGISVCLEPDGWNVGVDLTQNNTIEKFIQAVIAQWPPVNIEYRTSFNNPNAINIRYAGMFTGDPGNPETGNFEAQINTFHGFDGPALQDNRGQEWAAGTAAETRVCLTNFFAEPPTVINCWNQDTEMPS